jgi:hypothetical protein
MLFFVLVTTIIMSLMVATMTTDMMPSKSYYVIATMTQLVVADEIVNLLLSEFVHVVAALIKIDS